MHVAERAAFFKRMVPLLMQWGATLYSVAVSLGLSVLFARSMGPSAFGNYTYVYVLASFLVLVQDGGFKTLLMRERVARSAVLLSRYDQLPSVALQHLLGSTIIFVLAAVLLSPWMGGFALAAGVFCFSAITLTQWLSALLRGAGEFQRDAVFLFAGRSLSAFLVVLAVFFCGATPVAIFLAWGVGLLLVLAGFHKDFPSIIKVPFRLPVWAYRSSVSFFVVGLASALYHQLDIVLLRHFLGNEPAVGHYAVAARMFDGVLLLAWPIALIAFRRMRTTASTDGSDLRFNFMALIVAFAAGLLLCAGSWLVGAWGVGLLFGSAYGIGAQGVIGWLFTALLFALPNVVLEQFAIATQHEKWFAACQVFAVCVSLTGNVLLVPAYGAQGAAWATIITEALLLVALIYGLWGELMRRTVVPVKGAPAHVSVR